jgi:hypothetical protein
MNEHEVDFLGKKARSNENPCYTGPPYRAKAAYGPKIRVIIGACPHTFINFSSPSHFGFFSIFFLEGILKKKKKNTFSAALGVFLGMLLKV